MKRLLLSLLIVLLTASSCFAGIDFDGVDDSITANNFLSNYSSDFTISCWYFVPTATTAAGQFVSSNTAVAGRWNLVINDTADSGKISFFFNNGTSYIITSPNNTRNGWHNAVITRNGNLFTLYEDSASVGTPVTQALTMSTSGTLSIGARASTAQQFLKGTLSEIAIWNDNLSTTNISALYNNGKPIRGLPLKIAPANLQSYWAINDGAIGTSADGDTVADLSGNGRNGTGSDGANNTGLTWSLDTFFRNRVFLIQ